MDEGDLVMYISFSCSFLTVMGLYLDIWNLAAGTERTVHGSSGSEYSWARNCP
jgi:hypothetical protein